MKYFVILLALLLTACDHNTVGVPPDKVVVTDQCLRRETFNECMKNLPAGPVATKYNDWDEVISECRTTSYYLSQRPRGTIDEKCRGN